MIVCAALMMGSFPTTVLAEKTEKVLIDLIELEEAAEPTEFPAKGMLHAMVAIDTKMGSDEKLDYIYDDMYFNVLVDQFQKVYASVEDLSAHLGYFYKDLGGTVIVEMNSAGKVIFAMGDNEACYTNYWVTGCTDMKGYPIMYEESMYVPLDAFIQITGASGFYCGTNENEKQELYIIPPQRTIMDDISEFCKNAYNRYAFTFEKDLKYTSDKTGKQAGMANVIEYLDGLLRLDWRSWIMVADVGWNSDKIINLNDDKNVDAFMDEVLKLNAASLDQMFASATSDASLPDVLMDVLVDYHQENIDVEMDYVDIMTAEWYKDAMRGCDVDFVARMKEQSKVYNEWHARSQQIGLASKALDIIGFAGGTISAYLKTLNNLKNGCDISVQGAKLLYNRRGEILNKTIKEDNVARISNKINSFQYEDIIETVNLQVFKKNQIDGLRVGEIKEDILAFLCSATRENDGKTILGIRIIEMPESMWQYDLQQFYSGLSMTYADFDQTTSVSDVVEKLILKEGVSFETIYSKMYGKNTYAGAMLDMIDQYTGIYSEHLGDSYEALRRSDLQEAANIQDFINAYVKEVGTYPNLEILLV